MGDKIERKKSCNLCDVGTCFCWTAIKAHGLDFLHSLGIDRNIENLKLLSSASVDGINLKFLKYAKHYFSIGLPKLLEQSTQKAVLPSDWGRFKKNVYKWKGTAQMKA